MSPVSPTPLSAQSLVSIYVSMRLPTKFLSGMASLARKALVTTVLAPCNLAMATQRLCQGRSCSRVRLTCSCKSQPFLRMDLYRSPAAPMLGESLPCTGMNNAVEEDTAEPAGSFKQFQQSDAAMEQSVCDTLVGLPQGGFEKHLGVDGRTVHTSPTAELMMSSDDLDIYLPGPSSVAIICRDDTDNQGSRPSATCITQQAWLATSSQRAWSDLLQDNKAMHVT